MNSRDDRAVWQADRDHFIHPYTDFARFPDTGSQVIAEANGVHIVDGQGRRLLDGIAGLWCVNVGHGRREIADVVAAQIRQMQYYNPFGASTNVPAALLSRELAQEAPGSLNHVFYSCGGSTANDVAIRIVHYYFDRLGMPRKKKILSRIDGYHGATYLTAALTGIHATKIGFHTLGDDFVHHVSAADMYRGPAGRSESAYCDFLVDEFERRILQLGPDNVAAFIAEPVMGAGGVLIAPEGYHQRMHAVCRRYGMLYIADEVVTGFGRLGEWFSSEALFGYVPDLLVCAKGITSGYVPLGATLLSDAVHEVIARPQCEDGVFSMGYTYSGHPVACAAALENMAIIRREGLLDHVRELGPHLQAAARGLLRHEIVGDVRGAGLMLGIDLVADRATKEGFPASKHAADQVFDGCLDNGVVVRPIGNRIVVSPPLIVSKADCDMIIDALDDALSRATPGLQH